MAGRPRKTTTENKVETIGKLQFKVVTDSVKLLEKLAEVPSQIEDIKKQVEEIEASFAYDIKEKEVVTEEQKKTLDDEVELYQQEVEEKKLILDESLENQKKIFERQIEQLKYQHSITVRDEDLKTSQIVASKHGMCLVDLGEWENTKSVAETNEEDITKAVSTAVQDSEQKIKNGKDAEIRNIKHSFEMKLAIADKDIESLTREVESLRKENASLKTTITEQNKNIVHIAESATRPTVVHENNSKK